MIRGEAEELHMRSRTSGAPLRPVRFSLSVTGSLLSASSPFTAGARPGMVTLAGEAELSRLAVAGQYRRRGIGRQLVEGCLQLGAGSRASALVLWSHPHQIEAHQLYLSLGFNRAPDRDVEGADGLRLVFIHRL